MGVILSAHAAQLKLAQSERRRKVATLYLGRVNQYEIARQLGVTQACVSKDIAAIQREYRAERNAMIEREVIDLEHLEQECAVRYATGQEGEWIDRRLAIKKRRAELLGLDAAKRIQLGLLSDGTRLDELSDDELLERYRRALNGGGDSAPETGLALIAGGDDDEP